MNDQLWQKLDRFDRMCRTPEPPVVHQLIGRMDTVMPLEGPAFYRFLSPRGQPFVSLAVVGLIWFAFFVALVGWGLDSWRARHGRFR